MSEREREKKKMGDERESPHIEKAGMVDESNK